MRNKIELFISRKVHSFKLDWQLWMFCLPSVAYLFIFNYIPMYGLKIAFMDFSPAKGLSDSDWIGFDHFTRFFNSHQFFPTLYNTVLLSFMNLFFGFFPPILLALFLFRIGNKHFKNIAQTITYAPHFISTVVLVSMIRLMTSPSSGVINSIIGYLGMNPVDFMGIASLFKNIYVISDIWQHMGWSSIIYMSALAGINPELYEAAKVDGAGKINQMRHIDLPGIIPTAVILLILATGNVMTMGMQKVLLMQNPLNLSSSEIISTYVYKTGLVDMRYGYSAAIGLFQSAINVILLSSVNMISKRVSDSGLW